MIADIKSFIESADIGPVPEAAKLELPGVASLNMDKLPDGIVSGQTLLDFSAVKNPAVRAGVSLAILFASRVATAASQPGDTDETWLAAYKFNLGRLGFALAGEATAHNKFEKVGLEVNKAIIPFLTVAFGGAGVGPIILAGLKNLADMDKDQPWITLFEQESRRFDAHELHFGAVSSNESETSIRYAVARLNVSLDVASVLFFKVTQATAEFESVTTTMTANNDLMAQAEPELRAKLAEMTRSFIAEAKLTK